LFSEKTTMIQSRLHLTVQTFRCHYLWHDLCVDGCIFSVVSKRNISEHKF
jgi:hypothetical protein